MVEELFEALKKRELSLRLYIYCGKVLEDAGSDAELFEINCLDWLSQSLQEAYKKGIENCIEVCDKLISDTNHPKFNDYDTGYDEGMDYIKQQLEQLIEVK